MKSTIYVAAAALLAGVASVAPAGTILVTPSVAPNAFGSPSYAGYVSNAVGALHDSDTSRGDPNSPTYYQANSNVAANQVIVTGFASWLGQANPGAVFGAQYAAELGNRMLFGLRIDGEGTQFSINQLSFNAVSNDVDNALGFGFGAGSYVYNQDYQGVLAGADNTLWTSDDVFVTSGPSSTLVDGLVGRGSGSAFAVYCDGCTTAQQQAAIDAAATYSDYPTQFTGTYSLGALTGSGTFNIGAAVPEPASWAMMIGGFGLIGGAMRSARHRPSLA